MCACDGALSTGGMYTELCTHVALHMVCTAPPSATHVLFQKMKWREMHLMEMGHLGRYCT